MIHLLLPITLYRPEEMRVIELLGNNMALYYVVQTYSPMINEWVERAEHLDLADAMLDAINWYSPTNVYDIEKVREAYKTYWQSRAAGGDEKLQIVDNLKFKRR